jgi:hypothetical protein
MFSVNPPVIAGGFYLFRQGQLIEEKNFVSVFLENTVFYLTKNVYFC